MICGRKESIHRHRNAIAVLYERTFKGVDLHKVGICLRQCIINKSSFRTIVSTLYTRLTQMMIQTLPSTICVLTTWACKRIWICYLFLVLNVLNFPQLDSSRCFSPLCCRSDGEYETSRHEELVTGTRAICRLSRITQSILPANGITATERNGSWQYVTG